MKIIRGIGIVVVLPGLVLVVSGSTTFYNAPCPTGLPCSDAIQSSFSVSLMTVIGMSVVAAGAALVAASLATRVTSL